MGTHMRVLSKSSPMNTNMTGFEWFSKIFASLCLMDEVALALEGLRQRGLAVVDKWRDYLEDITSGGGG